MTLTCNTIQDLLSLWADDVLHPGSREEVEAHLAACPACRKKAEALRPQTQETSLPPLPVPARRKRRKLVGLALAVLLAFGLLTTGGTLLVRHPVLASRSDAEITTGFYRSPTSYLGQRWGILFTMNNAVLCPKTEYIQGELADGTTATVGMTIRICKEWLGHANAGQAICYAWPIQPEQVEAMKKYPEDFTVTVIFQDQTLTYSLTDAGFLTKQPTQPDPMGNDGQDGGTPCNQTTPVTLCRTYSPSGWTTPSARIPKLSSNSIFPTAPPAGEFWRIWMRRLLCRRSRMPHRCVL